MSEQDSTLKGAFSDLDNSKPKADQKKHKAKKKYSTYFLSEETKELIDTIQFGEIKKRKNTKFSKANVVTEAVEFYAKYLKYLK